MPNVELILINGLGASGKSTFCGMCKDLTEDEFKKNRVYVQELSTVDYPKEVAKFCGWTGNKEQSDRIFLSDIKKALEKWNGSPIHKVFEAIRTEVDKDCSKYDTFIFFVNSREPEDHELIGRIGYENGYNVTSMLIRNDLKESNEVPELIQKIRDCHYDTIIENNGTLEELKQKARHLIELVIGDIKAYE